MPNNKYIIGLLIISYLVIRILYKWKLRLDNIKSKPNIVILGLSRTGTSSICEALKILGNEVWHFTYFTPQIMRKLGFNVIGDLPYFRRNFTVSDIEPNTKYILTTRSSKKWKISMNKWLEEIWNIDINNPHIKPPLINKYYNFKDNIFKRAPLNIMSKVVHNITHEYPEIYTGNLKEVIKNHEKRLVTLFNNSGNRDKLLLIDITDKSIDSLDKWKKLCKFLKISKIPQISVPKESYENIYVKQIKRVI
jgi:hypothetical protein